MNNRAKLKKLVYSLVHKVKCSKLKLNAKILITIYTVKSS